MFYPSAMLTEGEVETFDHVAEEPTCLGDEYLVVPPRPN
jgi:hypothetical protein